MEIDAEIVRLRSEVRMKVIAFNKLQNEKDNLNEQLRAAYDQIAKLREDIDIRDKFFAEYREKKEKEYTELLRIKTDREARLLSTLEVDAVTGDHESFSLSIALWSQSISSDVKCSEILQLLQKWEGVDDLCTFLKSSLLNEEEHINWKPGTPWNLNWKPCITLYVSGLNNNIIEHFSHYVLLSLEKFCKSGGSSLSVRSLSLLSSHEFDLGEQLVLDISLHEMSKSDIFLCFLQSDCDVLTKIEVENGFLNNPNARPTVFVLFNTYKSKDNYKLRHRLNKMCKNTKIIECQSFTTEVASKLVEVIKNILHTDFDISEINDDDKDEMFSTLTLFSDMRSEFEQIDILSSLLLQSPKKPPGIDITFEQLIAYKDEVQQPNVACYMISAPNGTGKSTILAHWCDYVQKCSELKIEVLYHFVSRPCSSSSQVSIMYRRFIHKLLKICGENALCIPDDSSKLESVFTELLEVTSARVKTLEIDMVFILIDNADHLMQPNNLSWILKPLPQYIRVVFTSSECPSDSWSTLPTCKLPMPTADDIQQVISGVKYGTKNFKLTEDQILSLAISTPCDVCQLWCVVAAKFVLSYLSKPITDAEFDELIETFCEIEDVSELVSFVINDLIRNNQQLAFYINQILQSVYWSRNGLSFFELRKLTNLTDVVLCYILCELRWRHVLKEVAGFYLFTNEVVQQFISINFDTDLEQMLYWSQILISLFSDISNQQFGRSTSELLWLMKRAEMHTDLISTLLNVDNLIQIFCGGENSLVQSLWQHVGVDSSTVACEYYKELTSMEEKAHGDSQCLLYIAMLYCTVGKILCNLGLCCQCQHLLQRSLEIYESNAEPDCAEVGLVMFELASIFASVDSFKSAESYFKQSMEVYQANYGENSKEVSKVLEALFKLYAKMNRADLIDYITTLLHSQRGQQQPNTLSLLSSRASLLESRLSNLGKNHIPNESDVLDLNEWSVLNAVFGDANVAEENFFNALQNSEHVLGKQHRVTQIIQKNLIVLYQTNEKFEEAIPLQKHIIELKQHEHGSLHTSVAAGINNLAVFYCFLEDYQAAEFYYDKAIDIYQKIYGCDHPLVLDTKANKDLANANSLQTI